MYTQEQYERALALYDWVRGSVTKTDHTAGISSQSANTPQLDYKAQTLTRGTLCLPEVNTPEHSRHPPLGLKSDALHRCFELGEDVQSVSDEIGYSTASLYQ